MFSIFTIFWVNNYWKGNEGVKLRTLFLPNYVYTCTITSAVFKATKLKKEIMITTPILAIQFPVKFKSFASAFKSSISVLSKIPALLLSIFLIWSIIHVLLYTETLSYKFQSGFYFLWIQLCKIVEEIIELGVI